MNALLVTEYFPPVTGGSPRWYDIVVRNARNLQWTVVTRPVEGAPSFERIAAHQIFRPHWWVVPPSRLKLSTIRVYAKLHEYLHECARRIEPAVIHGMPVYGAALPALILAKELGVPFIAHVFGEEFGIQGKSLYRRHVMKQVLSRSDAVVANSERTLEEAVKFGADRARSSVIFAVDLDALHPVTKKIARKDLGVTGDPVLLTVSRIVERKGHDSVIRVLKRLSTEFPDLRYNIAGDGPDRARLEELARSEGVSDRVSFMGYVPDENLSALYSSADLFVMPNRELPSGEIEGLGFVFLEAAACGVPSIGGRSGGTSTAIQDGVTGVLVDPLNEEELATNITTLLRDRGRMVRMGMAAAEHARKISSITDMIQRLEALPGDL